MSSRSYAARDTWRGVAGLLKNATRCWPWRSTTPNPYVDASHSSTNGWVKSGRARTGVVVTMVFGAVNAAAASGVQEDPSLQRRADWGAAIVPNSLTNLR